MAKNEKHEEDKPLQVYRDREGPDAWVIERFTTRIVDPETKEEVAKGNSIYSQEKADDEAWRKLKE